MRFLLDTHILLWAIADSNLLPSPVAASLADPGNAVYFSVVNLWEIVIKSALTRRDMFVDPVLVRREALAAGFQELAVTADHVFTVATLPPFHRDPFDRLLIAQARAEHLDLMTVDARIQLYLDR